MDGKSILFRINYMVYRGNSVVEVTRTANLTLDWDTNFKSISKFVKDLERAFAGYRFCAKNGNYCNVEMSCMKYHTEEGRIVTDGLDVWNRCGYPEVDPTGILLDPDPKNTKVKQEVWIDFQNDVMNMLADIGV